MFTSFRGQDRSSSFRNSLHKVCALGALSVMSLSMSPGAVASADERPNVIIVLLDDQGYGDRGVGGNPDLGQEFRHPLMDLIDDYNANSGQAPITFTPHLNAMRADSVSFTDFHVTPTCATTRAQLMTGRDAPRTRVLFPVGSGAVMQPEEQTIAELFGARGYRTGIFGKWNLGPTLPSRPQDQGWDVVRFLAGGANSSSSNAWDPDCFGDTFFNEDGDPILTSEDTWCGDYVFDEGLEFIEDAAASNEPFLAYITTPDPHWLLLAEDNIAVFPKPPGAQIPNLVDYDPANPSLPDGGLDEQLAGFFSQIARADEGLGRLRDKLAELQIEDDTILIVLGDNGSSILPQLGVFGFDGADPTYTHYAFDGGVAGGKFESRDGGHRNYFYIHYPAGGVSCTASTARGDSCFNDALSSVNDIIPTTLDLAGFEVPEYLSQDAQSLVQAAVGDVTSFDDRKIFQIVNLGPGAGLVTPGRESNFAVRTEDFILVNSVYPRANFENIPVLNEALFDIKNDPGQTTDLSTTLPSVKQELRDAYDAWYDSWIDEYPDPQPFVVGSNQQNPTTFNSDVTLADRPAPLWSFQGTTNDIGTTGQNRPNLLEMRRSGQYEVTIARWPFLGSGASGAKRCPDEPQSLGCPIDPRGPGQARLLISPERADAENLTLTCAGPNCIDVTETIPAGVSEYTFSVKLNPAGNRPKLYMTSTVSGVHEVAAACDVSDPEIVSDPAKCPVADGRNGYHIKIERK